MNSYRKIFILISSVFYFSLIATQPVLAVKVRHKVAVFDFELIDTSLEGASWGVDQAETLRLIRISELLRQLLSQSGRYRIVDLAPATHDIRSVGLLYGCNGCAEKIARKFGATHTITGTVTKISTLILSIEIKERNALTGDHIRTVQAQIRGNTDKSWKHGVKWLVRNRLLQGASREP